MGDATPQEAAGEGAPDLFDRWLAHRGADAGTPPAHARAEQPSEQPPEQPAAAVVPEQSPEQPAAAVAPEPGRGPAVPQPSPGSHAGAAAGASPASPSATDGTPPGFEPVVVRAGRRKEPRLGRRPRRTAPEQPRPSDAATAAPPALAPGAGRHAARASEPSPDNPEARPVDEVDPAARAELAQLEARRLAEMTAAAQAERRAALEAERQAAAEEAARVEAARVEAARVEAERRAAAEAARRHAEEQHRAAAEQRAAEEAEREAQEAEDAARAEQAAVAAAAGSARTRNNLVEFEPRTAIRRAASVVLLLSLAASVAAVWGAYQERTELRIGLAVVLAVLTAFVWAVRAGASVTRLTLRGGQLEVVRAGKRQVFDLNSRYTPVEVVGTPGRRGWRVEFLRRGMPPYVIDSSMVDPHEFTAAIRRYRPDL